MIENNIKFRGKRLDKKSTLPDWVYGYFTIHPTKENDQTAFIIDVNVGLNMEKIIPESIGQYVGIKDHDGIDVHVGDICIYDHEDGPVVSEVIYKKEDKETMWISGFAFKFLYRKEYENDEPVHFKILGNIHDNPDLLIQN